MLDLWSDSDSDVEEPKKTEEVKDDDQEAEAPYKGQFPYLARQDLASDEVFFILIQTSLNKFIFEWFSSKANSSSLYEFVAMFEKVPPHTFYLIDTDNNMILDRNKELVKLLTDINKGNTRTRFHLRVSFDVKRKNK